MLRESFNDPQLSPWIRKRFDVIGLNTRGAREVAFNESLTATEKELTQALGVTQTPALIFLDAGNRVVMRSDGYRTHQDLRRILDYVDSKSYLSMDLPSYIAKVSGGPHYALRPHPLFSSATDLSKTDKPVMVIFEDGYCTGCDLMHDTLLKNEQVNQLMKSMLVVRLDARSDTPVVTPSGEQTTARKWADSLDLSARPGILLFTGPVEQVRIAGVLRRWHFQTALRYVAEERYDEYPTLREFSRWYREKLIAEGKTIDLGVQ